MPRIVTPDPSDEEDVLEDNVNPDHTTGANDDNAPDANDDVDIMTGAGDKDADGESTDDDDYSENLSRVSSCNRR